MTINRENRIYKQIVRALELIFLALAGMYFIYRLSKSTTFHLVWPGWFELILMRGMVLVAFARLLTTRLARRETLIALALAGIYGMVYRTDGYTFLLYLAIFTVGFIDIDHRRIARMYLLSAGVFYCVTVLAGSLGVITNYIRIKNGLRSAWGMSYPTDFAALGFYLLLALWMACRKLPDWAMLMLTAAFGLCAWFIAHSSTSTVCVALLFCAILYQRLDCRMGQRSPCLKWLRRGADLFATVSFPLVALCVFALMAAYAAGTGFGYKLNTLLTNRLEYMVAAWKQYGLKPFGTPFAMHGNGFSVFPQTNYTFVDSSYPLILLRYGWVLFLAICLFWGWTACKAIRCGDRRVVLAMGIIAIHSFSEHHFIDSHFNLLLVMPLAAYTALEGDARAGSREIPKRRKDGRGHADTAAGVAAVALFVIAACLAGPAGLSWLKTVLEFKNLGHGAHSLRLVCVLFCALCGLSAVFWSVHRILRTLLRGAPLRACRAAAVVLALSLCVGCGVGFYANRAIDAAARQNAASIANDREALEIAVRSTSGKVYSGVLPAVYRRNVTGLDYAPFFEGDLARLRGNTVLMSADTECGPFFDSGYLYVQISDAHALYTGDRAVVEALAEAGYHPTGYYSNSQSVPLGEAAEKNGLSYDAETGLRLDGGTAMANGPWQDLYAGKYTATWELSLPEGASREDGVVCTLTVSADKGENVLLEKKVRAEQFDASGKRSVSVPFTIPDSRNVAFEARTEAGRQVDIVDVSFVHTPDFDIHVFYNSDLKAVRKEYYSRDGSKTLANGGYFACEYEYDGWKNISSIQYFDRENRPTLTTAGYARMRRRFNARRQVIRAEYYGTDDAPIALVSGEAADEREYDADGNIVVQRYYGVDGRPVSVRDGYAQVRRRFNDKRQVVGEAYYGLDGLPVALSGGEYAIEQEYDSAGNVSVRRFYDDRGKPMLTKSGYAQVRWVYDGQHQIIHEAFYGVDGAPIAIRSKQAANDREYDDAGNVIVYRYYDTEDKPVLISSGYAEVRRVYNGQRKVVREAYYGVDGEPIALSDGQYAVENEYDDVGNVSIRRFYDGDGSLLLCSDGYAEVHWFYNDMRRVVREEFYGTDGAPILNINGEAANEREYDQAGNVTAYRYFDTQNAPVVTARGCAALRRAYDERRRVVREEYLGVDGRPLAQPEGHAAVEMEYDDMGNVSAQRYYDASGNPVVISAGYAQVHRVYDRRRQVVREDYYDAAAAPCPQPAGHTGIRQTYDENGKLAARLYVDAQGDPVTRVDGYSEARWTTDGGGARHVSFLDTQGNAVSADGINTVRDGPSGWSKWFTPRTNSSRVNVGFALMNTVAGEPGESYTCQVEIEFSGVRATAGKPFRFRAHGLVEGAPSRKNLWNPQLVDLDAPPQDGVYRFVCTQQTDAQTASAGDFNLGFLCDYWAGGKFRVRFAKVERGDAPSAWTPGI